MDLHRDLRTAQMHGLWRDDHPLSSEKIRLSRFEGLKAPIGAAPVKLILAHDEVAGANLDILPLNTDAPNIDSASQLATVKSIRDAADRAITYIESGGVMLPNSGPGCFPIPDGSISLGKYLIKALAPEPTICDISENKK